MLLNQQAPLPYSILTNEKNYATNAMYANHAMNAIPQLKHLHEPPNKAQHHQWSGYQLYQSMKQQQESPLRRLTSPPKPTVSFLRPCYFLLQYGDNKKAGVSPSPVFSAAADQDLWRKHGCKMTRPAQCACRYVPPAGHVARHKFGRFQQNEQSAYLRVLNLHEDDESPPGIVSTFCKIQLLYQIFSNATSLTLWRSLWRANIRARNF